MQAPGATCKVTRTEPGPRAPPPQGGGYGQPLTAPSLTSPPGSDSSFSLPVGLVAFPRRIQVLMP